MKADDIDTHPHFRWIRPTQQARSQETLERLLDSTEALIADKGFDDVTVAEIAARAGLSVGAVYSRFRDKKGVLNCLRDRFVDEAHLTTDAAFDPDRWQGASIEEIASELIVFLVEIHRERRGVVREMAIRTRAELDMAERKKDLVAHIGKRLWILLDSRSDQIGHPDPEVATGFGLRFLLATLEQALLFDEAGIYGMPVSDDRLAAELTRAFLSYLCVENRQQRTGQAA